MDYAEEYPEYGDVLPVEMKDPRWPADDGWKKRSLTINDVEIHYVYNPRTGQSDDFKYKDRTEPGDK